MPNFSASSIVLSATCPKNAILTDDKGLPSFMVYVPKFKISDVIDGGSDSILPAFIVNGVEVDGIYISKYQNVVYNGRAYSLPMEAPTVNITFDTAKNACQAKGAGWHLMSNAEWAAIALWCRKNDLMPKGNNNYGKDTTETGYVAIPAAYDSNVPPRITRVKTGTGPKTWSHNGDFDGIWDLNGNVSEWVSGYRSNNGEIQVIENNNSAAGVDETASSTLWKAILENGSLVTPGTADTLKWDYITLPTGGGTTAFKLNKSIVNQQSSDNEGSGSVSFAALTADASITAVPEILKALALFPADSGDHGGDSLYMRNNGERLMSRGGGYGNGAADGVFCGGGYYPRSSSHGYLGFRSAFVAL